MYPQTSLTQAAGRRITATRPVVEQERELVGVGAANHWPFRVLGIAPVPTEPVFHNNWWLVPVSADHSEIPTRALERVQAIYEAGIRPKAWVILHEARPLLSAPADAPKISPMEFWAKNIAQHSVTVLKVTGAVLAVAVPVVLTVLGASAMMAIGLASVVLTDPCLIAVTDDDVWVMVDSWMF